MDISSKGLNKNDPSGITCQKLRLSFSHDLPAVYTYYIYNIYMHINYFHVSTDVK